MPDAWIQPSRQTVPDQRTCGRCRRTYRRGELGVGWVATRRPRPAWVCPACCRETGMVPGDWLPPLVGCYAGGEILGASA